ncbi:MAG: MopE-related protein [bacterium]|nr:MopE-related protein [bacterium]
MEKCFGLGMIAAGLLLLAQCGEVPKVGEGHNYPPLPPSLNSPFDGSDAATAQPALTVNNGADPEEAALTYTFEIYSDQGLTHLVANSGSVPETANVTSWTVTQVLTEEQWYFWRSRSNDGNKDSQWMPAVSFRVNAVNSAPGAPGYPALADGTEVNGQTVRLEIGPASDPDGKTLFYEFQVDTALDFSSANSLTSGSQPDPFWLTPALSDNTVWYWRARALDNFGAALAPSGFSFAPGAQYLEGPWSGVYSFFVNTANDPPSAPALSQPPDGGNVSSLTLAAGNAADPDRDALTYEFQVSSTSDFATVLSQRSGLPQEDGGVTSWTISQVLPNGLYYWRCRASDGMAASSWAGPRSFRFTLAQNNSPAAPVLSAPVQGSFLANLTPALAIQNATDSEGDTLTYEFQVSATTGFSTLAASAGGLAAGSGTTGWTISPALFDGTVYYWRARASDGKSSGAWSEVWSFTTDTNGVPSALTPAPTVTAGNGEVNLAWTYAKPADFKNFVIMRSLTPGTGYTEIAATAAASYRDIGLTNGTTYFYVITVVDKLGRQSGNSPEVAAQPKNANTAPGAPASQTPAAGVYLSTLTPALMVQNAVDPEGDALTYEFQVSLNVNFSPLAASATGIAPGSGSTAWTVAPALADGTVYYWRARVNDGSLNGPWSEVRSFTTDTNGVPAALTLAPTATAGDTKVDLSWSYAPPADFGLFKIYISSTSGGPYTWLSDTTGNNFQSTGLTNGATYYYVITAVDKLGRQSGNSPQASAQPKKANTAPGAPTSQTPAAGAYPNTLTGPLVVVNASDPEGDTLTYEFQVSLNVNFSPLVASLAGVTAGATKTSWAVSPVLTDGTVYYWRARAYDGALNGPWSEVRSFTTDTNGVPEALTLALTATAGDQKVNLSWTYTQPSDFDHYKVYRGLASGGPYTWLSDTNANSYQDGGLTNGTPYYYVIQVVDHLGRTSGNSPQAQAKPNSAPGTPTNSAPALGAYLDMLNTPSPLNPPLEVENASDPEGDALTYEFQVSEDINFPDPVTIIAIGVAEGILTTSWEVRPHLADGINYYWRARASDGLLNGPWSEVWLFTTDVNGIPATPAAPIASPGNNLVNLSWTYSRPADFGQFKISRSETSGGPYLWIADTTGNSFKDTGLTNGTMYFYVIAAADQLGRKSANSPEASAQPGNLDTDGDEMPDSWENAHGLNPNDPADAALDADSDGLNNLEEYQHSTDPQDADSDDDGLNDGPEVNTYLTNPLDSDTDNDGLRDGEEVAPYNTDPTKPDTDGDGDNDGAEVLCGSDPNDPLSVCVIEDKDGDGFAVNVDCDDNNPYINPGRAEICGNPEDENCSGKCSETAICGGSGMVLQGDYLTIGINQSNSLVNGNWDIGFRFDPDGQGPLTYDYDWLTANWGMDVDGWSLEYEAEHEEGDWFLFHNGRERNAPFPGEKVDVVMSLENRSRGRENLVIGAGRAGDLIVTQMVSYPQDVSYVIFTVTIENPGPVTATAVRYLRQVNPDIDDEQSTFNDVIATGLITARGEETGQVLALGSWEPGAVASAFEGDEGYPGWILEEPWDPDGDYDDLLLGLMFDLGDIQPRESRTFNYYYLAGTSVARVQRTFNSLENDWDGDGISNSDEIANTPPTDPRKADSDADGLNDSAEIFGSGTNPGNYDTDGDGIPDGEEARMGRDPLDPSDPPSADTDGDGIPDWKEWVSGSNPNNPDMDGDGLNDGAEMNQYCTDPRNPDTDGDGLSDGFEVNTSGSNPADPDTDWDGLPDGDEVNTYGTDPADPDTDNDGSTDWTEVRLGTDPQDPDSHPAPIPRIKINEVGTYDYHWVEFFNPETYTVRLTHWVLRWSAGNFGSGEVRLPPVVMPPGSYIGMDAGCNNDDESWYYFCEDINWCDMGSQPGSVALLNDAGVGVDFVRWGGDAQEPPPGTSWTESGPISFPCRDEDLSLQRRPGADTDSDADWYVARETAGWINDSLDSDDDDIPDYYEVNDYHTDPYNRDTDGDLINDYYELFESGTDPLDPFSPDPTDSDGDGISDFAESNYYGTDPENPDSDGDGLNDYEEIFIYGTNPWSSDEDGDGLSDGEEVLLYHTSPWDWDTDEDGLGDYAEIFDSHTNPNKPDTDGDNHGDLLEIQLGSDPNDPGSIPAGIPESEPNNTAASCDPVGPISPEAMVYGISNGAYDYDFYCIPVTVRTLNFDIEAEEFGAWIDSEIFLYDRDGNTILAENDDDPDPDTDYYDMDAHLTYSFPVTGTYYLAVWDDDGNSGASHYWYYLRIRDFTDSDGDGLTDQEETLVYFTNPLNADSDGDGMRDGDEICYDGDCRSYTPGSDPDPNDPDSDNDGLSDGEEWHMYGSNPTNPDTDGDGLSDGDEGNTYGSSPSNPDTDGDGLNDYQEVVTYGSNPNSVDTDGDGLNDYQEVITYGTDPADSDSDDDGYSDWQEINSGSDPNSLGSKPSLIFEEESNNSRAECNWLEFPDPVTAVFGVISPSEDSDYYCLAVTMPVVIGFDSDAAEFGSALNPYLELYDADGQSLAWNDQAPDPDTQWSLRDAHLTYSFAETGTYYIRINDVNWSGGSAYWYYLRVSNATDSDNDGLTDWKEAEWETGRHNWDTDGDLVSDGDEVRVYHTDPLDPNDPDSTDTDGDGISNFAESNVYGTNPGLSDSDGDGLEDYDEIFTYETDPSDSDSDGDGLSDGEEVLTWHTDPNNTNDPSPVDTDEDGLPDWWETNIYGTNPGSADTDGDGLPDGDEVNIYGTNPGDSDSDDDGLDDDEEVALAQCRKVAVFQDAYPWNESANFTILNNQGIPYTVFGSSDFGVVDLSGFNKVLVPSDQPQNFLTLLSSHRAWLENWISAGGNFEFHGCDDGYQGGIWNGLTMPTGLQKDNYWVVSSVNIEIPAHPLMNGVVEEVINNWGIRPAYGYLTAFGNTPQAVVTVAGLGFPVVAEYTYGTGNVVATQMPVEVAYAWGYGDGEALLGNFIGYCGRTANPLNPDTDGDGLEDGEEVHTYHTDPRSVDTDGDGLSDSDEVNISGTDPLLLDTDGDGLKDSFESSHGTNPLLPDTDGDGYSDRLEVHNGSDPNLPASTPVLIKEIEPNEDSLTCTPIGFPGPITTAAGVINPDNDEDVYCLDVTAPVTLVFDIDAAELGSSLDSRMYLAAGSMLAYDDNSPDPDTDWSGNDSHFTYTFSDPATYYIVVWSTGNVGGPSEWYYMRIKDITDTDGDGLTDWEEIHVRGTLPNNPDTDGDGIIDGAEIAHGTDPLDPGSPASSDVDGDGYANASDCDPFDPYLNPGRVEICGNEVDENCSGTLNDGCAETGGITLAGDYITLGINQDNSLIDQNSWIGLRYDPDGSGPRDRSQDWIVPGPSLESWTLSFNGSGGTAFYTNSAPYDETDIPMSLVDRSSGTIRKAVGAGMAADGLIVTQVAEFRRSDKYINFNIKIENTGENPVTGVKYLRNVDPNMDAWSFDWYATYNDVLLPAYKLVVGEGPMSGYTLGLGSYDPRVVVSAEGWFQNDPDEILDSPEDPDGYRDNITINLAADLGTLNPGESTTLAFFYVLGDSPANVQEIYENLRDSDGDGMSDAWETAHGLNPGDPSDAGLDPDTDGLTNLEEFRLGADPGIPDTDGDGLGDGDEVNTYSTDPAMADTDGDGLSDPDEILTWHTDPTDPNDPDPTDTDSDGLSDWAEATIFSTNPDSSDTDGDGISDGDEVLVWHTNPNNDYDPNPDLDTDGDGLPDWWETNVYGTNPINADTDGDGLEDGYEINVSGTNPADPDSDHDGYWDRLEVMVSGTDPNRIDDEDGDLLSDWDEYWIYGSNYGYHDSDDDGISDGQEVSSGTDPLDWNSKPEESCEEYVSLYDANGYRFDLYYGDNVSSGTHDAYNGGYILNVNGNEFSSECHVLEAQGREVAYEPMSVYAGGNAYVEVSRKIFVPADDGFARFLEILRNNYDYSINVDVGIYSYLGSDDRTMTVATSSGDQDFNEEDRWLVTDDDSYDGGREPSLAHVFAGPGGRIGPDWAGYADGPVPDYEWNNLTIGPYQTVIIMHFAAQNYYRQDSVNQALELESLGGSALRNMLTLERASVINWNVPIDSDSDGLGDWEEERLGANPPLQDTDGDGLSDWMEINIYRTDPNKADMDGDGLTDGEELHVYGTAPDRPDSDGDGLSDREERDHLTDPWSIDTDEDGYSDNAEVIAGTNPRDEGSAPAQEFWENFDEGGAIGWSWNGLWYMDGDAANYRRDGSEPYDYNTGTINSGSLISPEFTVPITAPVLSFMSQEDTECNGVPECKYDVRQVYISSNGGLDWDLLWQSDNYNWGWTYEVAVSLAGYEGQNAIIRFFFNTVDANNNNYAGWQIDWVSVLKGPLPWAKSFGGPDYDEAWSVQQTSDRGYLVAGYTDSSGLGSDDVWVMKLYSDGTVAWQKAYGGAGGEWADSAQQTSDGGYVVAGATNSFGSGNSDLWVLKLDEDGTVAWQKTYGGTNADETYSIQQTSDGGYIAAGYSYSFGASDGNIWVLKLDADGEVTWQKIYGGTNEDMAYFVQQTSDGGYIVAGYTYSFAASNTAMWVLKLDTDGTVTWQKTYEVGDDNWAYSVQQTSDGGYIVAGYTNNWAMSTADFWVLKLDADGAVVWEKTYGGTKYDFAYAVRQTSDGGYVVAGQTYSFGEGNSDVWVLKLDADGAVDWEKAYGGADRDLAYSIQQTAGGGYVVAGYTESFGAGSYESWVLTLSPDGDITFIPASGAGMVNTSATVTDTSATVTNTSVVGVDSGAVVTDNSYFIVDPEPTITTQAPYQP